MVNWDFYVNDEDNNENIRLDFKKADGESIEDLTITRQSDLDTLKSNITELQTENSNLTDTIQSQQTIIDNLNSTIDTLNKTIFIDLRTNALYHNGYFEILAYNLKGEGVTGATVTLKVVWNSNKSTSTVTMKDKGNGVYYKDNFLGTVSDFMVHCDITFVKDDITIYRHYDIYMK